MCVGQGKIKIKPRMRVTYKITVSRYQSGLGYGSTCGYGVIPMSGYIGIGSVSGVKTVSRGVERG